MSDWADAALEELLAATGDGDRQAFAELYRRTSAKLYAVVHRILYDHSKTDDAVHDCYVRIWRTAGAYDAARGRPITWLATLARNIAIDLRRREAARGGGRFADVELEAMAGPGDAASSEMLVALNVCLDRLDPEQRQLVVAAYLDGDSREELAARSGRPIGTIKSWLHRSLATLKACLDG